MTSKINKLANRTDVYNAPVINYDNGTYTPVSNKSVMDLIDEKIRELDMIIKNEEYRVAVNNQGMIRGVIGSYDLKSSSDEFGQRVVFRNSYDKSMSFAFVAGACAWINN